MVGKVYFCIWFDRAHDIGENMAVFIVMGVWEKDSSHPDYRQETKKAGWDQG